MNLSGLICAVHVTKAAQVAINEVSIDVIYITYNQILLSL